MQRIYVKALAAVTFAASPVVAILFSAAVAGAGPSIAGPFEPLVDCAGGADAVGTLVAGGGDFDGDGNDDFAYAAPCYYANGNSNVGRVWIRDGKDGRLLRSIKGAQAGMAFGAAIAFVGDLNGDGADELAVGAPLFDPVDPASATQATIRDAGEVRVLTKATQEPLLLLHGSEIEGYFGSSLAGRFDFNGDATADFVVGAKGARSEGVHKGAAYWMSGEDGAVLATVYGQRRLEDFGLTVQNVGKADSDDTDDVLVTSAKNPVGDVTNAGAVAVHSGAAPEVKVVDTYGGAVKDRLGASSGSPGSDGSFIVGSPGERVNETILEAGSVSAFLKDGTRKFSKTSDVPQEHAQFGAAVASIGDVNRDAIPDYAVSAPFHDVVGKAPPTILEDAGRLSVLSGSGGQLLRVHEGGRRLARMGRSLAGGIDLDEDGIGDIISGNPGDAPGCRRNAGTVKVFSGNSGSLIRTFAGARGFQTRIFAGLGGSTAKVRSFLSNGTPRGVNASLFSGQNSGELSVAVLDEGQRPRKPGSMRIAVGTGHGSKTPRVAILRARRKSTVLEEFDAFDRSSYQGGVNVAAGDLDDDGKDELVVAQADSTTFDVYVHVLTSFGPNPPGTDGWRETAAFRVFAAADRYAERSINAKGVNVAVVPLPDTRARGIAVAPAEGAPVVRVFDAAGQQLFPDWVAYTTAGTSGVNLAVIDLEGSGNGSLVTAPRSGSSVVRVFGVDGAMGASFQPFAADSAAGATVAGADVDCDGQQEILVLPGAGKSQTITAYESNGAPVAGFQPFAPFDGTKRIAIAGTDRFLRK